MSGMPAPDAKQVGEYFGVDRHVDALLVRIDESFARPSGSRQTIEQGPARGDGALVVGVYGPWGCGKTTWLRRLETKVEQREQARVKGLATPTVVTIPIAFNAWQFEREEHLIVPLLKTAEAAVRKFVEAIDPGEDQGSKARFVRWLGDAWKVLGDASVALASGLSGEFTFGAKTTLEDTPLGKLELSAGPKLGLNVRTVFDKYAALRAARTAKDSPTSPLDAYASLYFDLRGHMRALTGRAKRPASWKALDEAGERLRSDAGQRRASQAEHEAEAQTHWWQWRRRRDLERTREAELGQPSQAALPEATAASDEETAGFELNLLFVIDDLDRCLPEKGVEMLEAIKLFLEVPGCAFVLAVDDEMVERGILHRYRDYGLGQQRKADPELDVRPPITGAEYLEKIVHLPVHVPPPSRKGVRAFVEGEYASLLASLEERARDGLLDLFDQSLPLVPRKVVRTLELFAMLHELGRGQPEYEPVLLARLVLVQLFAPELYRVRRMRYGKDFLVELQAMKGRHLPDVITEIEQAKQREGLELKDKITLSVRERIAGVLARVLAQRVDFDPRDALAVGEDYAYARIEFHLNLVIAEGGVATGPVADARVDAPVAVVAPVETPPVTARQPAQAAAAASPRVASSAVARSPEFVSLAAERSVTSVSDEAEDDSVQMRELEPISSSRSAKHGMVHEHARKATRDRAEPPSVQLRDIAGFVAFALSEDPADWRKALTEEGERLVGRVLDEVTFAALQESLRRPMEGNSVRLTPDWVRAFGGMLTTVQLQTLLRDGDVLARQGQELGKMLDAICRRVNPPNRRDIIPVHLGAYSERLGRKFMGFSFEGAYLRGLVLHGANLSKAVFRGADLERVDLGGAILEDVDWSGARLWETVLEEAMLNGGKFQQVEAVKCVLRNAKLERVDFRQSTWTDCIWTGAALRKVTVGPTRADQLVLSTGRAKREVPAWFGRPCLAFGHRDDVKSLAWSPDGRRLASGSNDRTIRVWSTEGRLLVVLEEHSGEVNSVAWSEDGKCLASGSSDKTVRVWDTTSWRAVVVNEHDGGVNSVAWSKDGRLASGSADKTVRVWSGKKLQDCKSLDAVGVVNSVAWDEGDRVASALGDGTLRVWSAKDGRLLTMLDGHQDGINSVAWSADGRWLASASADHTVRVWETKEWRQVAVLEGHEEGVNSVSWSPNVEQLASGSDDWTVRTWKAVEWRALRTENHGDCHVHVVAWSADGKRLVSGGADKTVAVWSLEAGEDAGLTAPLTTMKGQNVGLTSVAWSPDGAQLAFGAVDERVRVWRMRDDGGVAVLKGHTREVSFAAWSSDGSLLATASKDKTVRVWQGQDGQALQSLNHTEAVHSVAWSSAGARLASGSEDSKVRVWKTGEWDRVTTLEGHTGGVRSVSWLGVGELLASGSADGTVRLWERGEQRVLNVLNAGAPVNSVAWSSGGRLAAGSEDGRVRVWAEKGERLVEPVLEGHKGPVNAVAWSADGAHLASGSDDGRVLVWDVRQGRNLANLAVHSGRVVSVAWSPDGAHLASASHDGTIRVWSLSTHQELVTIESVDTSILIHSADGNFSLVEGSIPAMLGIPTGTANSRVLVPLAGLRLRQDAAAIVSFLAGRPTITRAIEPEPRWGGDVVDINANG